MDDELFDHQKSIADRIAGEGRLALYCEQGTGKTRALLEGVRRLKDPYPMLVVAPVTVMGVWAQEARRWIGEDAILVRGTKAKRQALLARDGRIWVMGYESLRTANRTVDRISQHGRRYKTTLNDVRALKPWRTVVADESSKIKHPTTKQSKALHAFSDTPYRFVLSGTPISHSPLDLWSQFRFLEPTLLPLNYYEFRARYAILRQRSIPGHVPFYEILDYVNLDELFALVAPRVVRYRKEDCLDLPEKLYQKIEVDLTAEQHATYRALRDRMIADVGDSIVVAPNVLARLMRLQQIVQGFATDEDGAKHKFKENPKLAALKDLLETVCVERTAVVWCRFTYDLDAVERTLRELDLRSVRVDGSVRGERRDEAIRAFQENDAVRAFVGQIQAAQFGITLTAASYVVFYSQDWNLDDRLQAEDRCHRIGTRWPVTYVDIVARRTVDATIAANLREKRKIAARFDQEALRRVFDGTNGDDR